MKATRAFLEVEWTPELESALTEVLVRLRTEPLPDLSNQHFVRTALKAERQLIRETVAKLRSVLECRRVAALDCEIVAAIGGLRQLTLPSV